MNPNHDPMPDLRLLDPSRDPRRWRQMVGRISRAAGPELAQRAQASGLATTGLLGLLSNWSWARPALSAAAALAAAAATVLALTGGSPPHPPGPGIADGLGYPQPVALWVETGRAPTVEELLASLEGDGR